MTISVDRAIKLADDFGWRVFPANPKNKRPLISGWQDKATSDPEESKKTLPTISKRNDWSPHGANQWHHSC